MNELRFLRLAFWLPIVVPLLVAVPIWVLEPVQLEWPRAVTGALALMVASLVYGGIPYGVFLILAHLSLRNGTLERAVVLSVFAPIIVGLLVAVEVAVQVLLRGPVSPAALGRALSVGAFVSLYAIALGYAYVVVVHGARVALRAAGVVQRGAG
jgi:hypothetical protein